jgi:threonyl-tRNA synthetase
MKEQGYMAQKEDIYPMRHSLAHIMATAVQHLWPNAKFGVGPVTENGFYYDVDLGEVKLSEEDLDTIEKEMKKVIAVDAPFVRSEKLIDDAILWAKQSRQPYKEELLNDLKRAGTTAAKDLDTDELGLEAGEDSKVEKVSFYNDADFTDLCRGPHIASTGKVGAFKLLRVSGAYWRGKDTNPQMQRLYGVAFSTEAELKQHLTMLDEAKKRDHRRLGRELDLFVFSDFVGSGLPLFTPRGTVIRDELAGFAESLRKASGFQRVSIPHITKIDLYKVSGHWDKFGDELFLVESQETSDRFALKPMNCPHHNQIYASQPRSYRDLPIKYFETTTVYRDEKSGELGGLTRVRSISQDDSHAYVRRDQLEEVVASLIKDVKTIYDTLGLDLRARLSFRDESNKYLGEPKLWDEAQQIIRELANRNELVSFEATGEAAFYGPKIDFMATDAIGREHQVATIQLDFVQPERFDLTYAGEDGNLHRPVMIHCALLGSIERFLGIYIEHTAGRFPVWLAPEQVRIITVNQEDSTKSFADEIASKGQKLGIRTTLDNSNESVGKKIRAAEVSKVPYTVVIGEKEITSGLIMPRIRRDLVPEGFTPISMTIDEFLRAVSDEVTSRARSTSL